MLLKVLMHFSYLNPLILQAMANGFKAYSFVFSVDNVPNLYTLHACMMIIIVLSSVIVVVVSLNSNYFIGNSFYILDSERIDKYVLILHYFNFFKFF